MKDVTTLGEDNHNLIYWFLHKRNLNIEEWYDIIAIGYVKGLNSYNPNIGNTFATYVTKCMSMEYNMELRGRLSNKRAANTNCVSLNNNISNKEDGIIPFVDVLSEDPDTTVVWVEEFLQTLNPKERDIIQSLLGGYTKREPAIKYGCTPTWIGEIVRKVGRKYRKWGVQYRNWK